MWPYIEKIRDLVKDLESRHQKAKDNLSQIETLGDSWKVFSNGDQDLSVLA